MPGSAVPSLSPSKAPAHQPRRQPDVGGGLSGWRWLLGRDLVLIAAVAGIALACQLLGERIPRNGGFGEDGVRYGQWAREFEHEIFVERVNQYHIQRILPSAVVHYSLRLLSIPRTDAALLRAFGLYAVGLLVFAAWCWCGIARELRLSLSGKWLGFVALFVNYISLKFIHYCVVGTDATAYVLGIVMLHCYLRGWTARLAVVTVLGAFAWPTCMYIGALLLVFPRRVEQSGATTPAPWHARGLTLVLLTMIGLGFWLALRVPPTVQSVNVNPQYVQPYRPALALSTAIALIFLALAAYPILNCRPLYDMRGLVTRKRLLAGMIVLAGIMAMRLIQNSLARPEPLGESGIYLSQTGYTALARPGVFLVTHIAFYGPFFILMLFLWPRTVSRLHEAGLGLTLTALFGMLFILNSQSRFFINIFPMVLPFLIKVVDEYRWGLLQLGTVSAASVLLSKVWFRINTGEFHGRLHEFPDQAFYMAHGPWISPTMYAVQGALFVALAVLLYAVCFTRKRGTPAAVRPVTA
jgi:hypothetical protein